MAESELASAFDKSLEDLDFGDAAQLKKMPELDNISTDDNQHENLAFGEAQVGDEKEKKQLNTSPLPFEECEENYMADQELQAVSTIEDKESDENEEEQQDISHIDLEQATQDGGNDEEYEEEQADDSLLELKEATQEGENYDNTDLEQQNESEQNGENIDEYEEMQQDGEFIEYDCATDEGENKDEIEVEQQSIDFIESEQATEECKNKDKIEEEEQDIEVLESDQATQDGENVQTNLETENGDSDEIQQDSLLSDSRQTVHGKDSAEEIDKPKDMSSLVTEQPLQSKEEYNAQVQSEQALQADENMENTKEEDSLLLDSVNEAQFEMNTQNEREQYEQNIPESEQTMSEKNKDLNEEDQQEVSVLKKTESNENQDDDDIEEVDVTFCRVCNMHFDKEEKYYSHVRGLLHAHQQMAYEKTQIEKAAADSQESVDKLATSGSTEVGGDVTNVTDVGDSTVADIESEQDSTVAGIEGKQDLALVPEGETLVAEEEQGTEFISNEQEEEEYNEEYWEEDYLDYDESSHCELCDLTTTGPVSLRSHLLGRNHRLVQEAIDSGTPVPRRLLSKLGPNSKAFSTKTSMVVNVLDPEGPSVLVETIKSVPEAIVGMWLVKEFTVGKQRSFLCTVCDIQCDLSAIQKHLIGSKHRLRYVRDYHPNVYAHIKSHGGRKSQLTAFLKEVCSDIESEMGRGAPVLKKPSEGDKSKKGGDLDIDMPLGGQFGQAAQNMVPESFTKKLPHEVIMEKYKEMKRRKEIVGSHLPHFGDVNKSKFGRPNQGQNLYAIPPPLLLQGPPPVWNRPFSVPPPFMDNSFQRFPPPGGIFPLPGAPFPPPMTGFPPPVTRFPPPANTRNNESQSFEMNRPAGLSQDDEWEKMYQEYQEKIRLSMSSHGKRKNRSRSSSFSSGSFSSGSSRGRRSTSRSKQFSSKLKSWSKRSRSREYRSRYSRSRSRERFLKQSKRQRQQEMDKQGDRSRFSRKILQSSRYLDKSRSRSRDYQSQLRPRDRLAQGRLRERHYRSRSRDIERSQSRDRKRRRSSGFKNWSPVTHQDKKRLLELARQQMSPSPSPSPSLSPCYPSDSPKYSFSDTSEHPEYSPRDVSDQRQGSMRHHSNREPERTASSSQMEDLKKLRMSQKLVSLGNQELPSRYSRNRSESDMDLEDETVDVTPETIRAQALKSGVNDLLENLTDNLISTEDDASMALEVSKALTQALLRYRVAAHATSKSGEASTSSQSQAQNYDTRPIYGKKPEQPQTYGTRPEPSSTYGNRPEQPSLYGMKPEQQPFYGRVMQTQPNFGKIPQQSQFYGNSGPPPFYGKMPEQQPYPGKRPNQPSVHGSRLEPPNYSSRSEPPLNYGNRTTQSNSSQAESRKIYEQLWIKSKWD